MTTTFQPGEKSGHVSRSVAEHASLKTITHTALPALQKKEDEDELQTKAAAQLKSHDEGFSVQKKDDAPFPAVNHTGMPDNLKTGIENLSGISLDDVKVHYNSDKPAQLSALAYAQGTDIHVAPGQERHLPHEAWHVVQQKQGRVKPNIQAKGVAINDDKGLEKEADVMGEKAISTGPIAVQKIRTWRNSSIDNSPLGLPLYTQRIIQRVGLANDKLNVAGENHDESGGRRGDEMKYSAEYTKGGGYWREGDFKVSGVSDVPADAYELRVKQLISFALKANFQRYLKMDTDLLVDGLISKRVDITMFELPWQLFRPGELEFYKDFIPEKVYNEYNETLLNKSSHFEKVINLIKTSLTEYSYSEDLQWKAELKESVTLFQLTFEILNIQIENVTKALGIISSEDISRQRSEKMHEAANNRAGTLGLWKIGDKHAQDMENMDPKAYKLLRRADFNNGYELYIARREALAKIHTKANGNWSPYTKGLSSKPKGVNSLIEILNDSGGKSIATVLGNIKARAIQESARKSKNRHKNTTDFYDALSTMDVDSTLSMKSVPDSMDNIKL